jgi:hypothetical protein
MATVTLMVSSVAVTTIISPDKVYRLATHVQDVEVVPPAGIEPAAFCSGGRRSIP